MRINRTRLLAAAATLAAVTAVGMPAAGATAPAHSAAQAARAADAVDAASVGGTAWYVDHATDQVVVTADSTVSRAELATIRHAAGPDADVLRVERTSGVLRPMLSAGDAIYGGQYRCSLGFNVKKGGTYYFLTAGHCGDVANTWYTDLNHNTLIGPTVSSSFPGNDYALVRYDNSSLSHRGGFTAADAYVGESVKRTGSTSGTHGGTVTALNVTVHYSGGGTVRGMIQTDVCAEPGDSGGPLYDGSKALGITSGGSGDCTSGGTTFYQPVTEAAAKYKVTVY